MTAVMWQDALVFARRNIEHTRQIPEKLLDVTMQPLMFVLLFAYVFGGAIAVQGGSYREYLIGGILIQSLTFAMVGPATSIATDLTEGVIDRFRSLPSSRASYLVGHYRPHFRVPHIDGLYFASETFLSRGIGVDRAARAGLTVAEDYLGKRLSGFEETFRY